jgi:hypothetical protein
MRERDCDPPRQRGEPRLPGFEGLPLCWEQAMRTINRRGWAHRLGLPPFQAGRAQGAVQ